MWTTSGVIQDAGSATNGFLTNLGIFANGGLPDCITASTTARANFSLASSPYTQLCLYAGMGGPAGITLNSYNGATGSGFFFNINGASYSFPGTGGGNVLGPNSSIDGDVATYNGTGGTILKDGGAPPALAVADVAALAARSIVPLNLGTRVRVNTYSVSLGIAAPPVNYFLSMTPTSGPMMGVAPCTPDGGSCIASSTSGYFWQLTPQTVWDARWWGAYEDAADVLGPTTVNASSCNIVFGLVGGQPFTSFTTADIGKLITVTDGVANGTNGASYIGTIAGVTDPQHIAVSAPCPTFNSPQSPNVTQNQHIAYGHDDAGAWNNASAFLSTIAIGTTTGQPVLSGGGGASAFASAPINFVPNAKLENIDFIALGYANLGFSCATTNAFCTLAPGVSTNIGLNIIGAFSTGENVIVDANYLPINPCFTRSNGTIYWEYLRCKNNQGSIAPVTISGASSTTAASITGSLANCIATPVAGEPYYCQLNVSTIVSGKVQPGQALAGAGIPAGTYVSQFGTDSFANAGSGGVGQYTVVNISNVLSNVTLESMTTLGLEVTVAACNQTNFNTLFNPTGLVYHNNANFNGILDRTFIVGCANSTTMVLNKAPARSFSSQNLTFQQDSNGFLAIGNAGVQIDNLTVSQDDANYFGVISNHYGCGQLVDGSGGSGYWHNGIGYGAANVCEGPDAANNQWRILVTVGVAAGGSIELNSPAFLAMDGAQNTIISDSNFGGQMQFFLLNAGSNTQTSILQNLPASQASQTIYAPNNTYWFYSEVTSNTGFMNLDLPYKNSNTPNLNTGLSGSSPYVATFTTGGSGSWQQFTAAQIARLSRTMSPRIPSNSGTVQAPVQPMEPWGLDLNTGPLTADEDCREAYTASATLHESDTGCAIYIASTGAGTTTITLGSDVGINSSSAYFSGVFKLPFIAAHSTQTVQLVMTSGTLFEGGGATSGTVTLTNNIPYSVRCPANVGGATPFCFLSVGGGGVNNVTMTSGPLSSAATTIFGFNRISRPATVVSIDFSANSFTCSANPVVQLLECGTSFTCATPVTIGSVTLTAAATGTTGTISSPLITAGDLIAARILSGTCTAINLSVGAELQEN